MTRSHIAAATLLIALGGASPATAEVLDQEFDGGGAEAHNGDWYRAQTFTVGITGKLTRVEAHVTGTGSSTFEIWDTVAGVPVAIPSSALASGTIHYNGVGFFGVDLSAANLFVTAGDVLALVQIGASHTGSGSWLVGDPNYAGGAAFTTVSTNVTGPWVDLNRDFRFKTYVTIPEPGTMALAGLGALGLAAARLGRRRRQSPG